MSTSFSTRSSTFLVSPEWTCRSGCAKIILHVIFHSSDTASDSKPIFLKSHFLLGKKHSWCALKRIQFKAWRRLGPRLLAQARLRIGHRFGSRPNAGSAQGLAQVRLKAWYRLGSRPGLESDHGAGPKPGAGGILAWRCAPCQFR